MSRPFRDPPATRWSLPVALDRINQLSDRFGRWAMKQILAFPVVVASVVGSRKADMGGSLTYPPEIIIENTVDLPPGYGPGDFEVTDAHFDLALIVIVFVVQVVVELLGG